MHMFLCLAYHVSYSFLSFFFFFSSRRRHTRSLCDWSSDVCSSDLFRKAGLHPVLTPPDAVAVYGTPETCDKRLARSTHPDMRPEPLPGTSGATALTVPPPRQRWISAVHPLKSPG